VPRPLECWLVAACQYSSSCRVWFVAAACGLWSNGWPASRLAAHHGGVQLTQLSDTGEGPVPFYFNVLPKLDDFLSFFIQAIPADVDGGRRRGG